MKTHLLQFISAIIILPLSGILMSAEVAQQEAEKETPGALSPENKKDGIRSFESYLKKNQVTVPIVNSYLKAKYGWDPEEFYILDDKDKEGLAFYQIYPKKGFSPGKNTGFTVVVDITRNIVIKELKHQ